MELEDNKLPYISEELKDDTESCKLSVARNYRMTCLLSGNLTNSNVSCNAEKEFVVLMLAHPELQ